jgi:EAL domain-containing protein (putative c-di-GMP-specific phosphodiesterase class I)/DNA-binding CsgD family transcriptional regulator/ActR/RegA family two-component response regulator
MRLLVFDDDPATGRLVARIAALAGIEAHAVTDVQSFRQRLRDAPPQVIVLDLQLGATDGIQQLRYLAEQQYAGALIVMSGFDARVLAATAVLAANLGLNLVATLSKPLEVETLEEVLQPLQSAWHLLSPQSLLAAIRDDALTLDFQPIVKRRSRTLNSLEALVRWDHPTLGRIPPADFLPAAESDRQVIDALTDWVIGATVDAYLVLRELGVCVPIGVNISTQNLHDLSLPDRLAQRLGDAGMPPTDLCLELTETAASRDTARMMDVLTRVRLKGVQLAIDDFGTGYSSLKALRQLPFSTVKIDRSFIADMASSRDSRAIVKSIIDLAANMEMDSVAEGVDSEATAALLEQFNVGAMQGFLIAAPMPVEAIPAWLTIWQAGGETDTALHLSSAQRKTGRRTDTATNVTGRPIEGPAVAPPDYMSGSTPAATPDAVASSARQLVLEVLQEQRKPTDASALSARQLEVMQLLTEGCSVKQIARRLDLGIGTVKVHLSRAYSVLGARNKVEAVMRAGLTAARTE